MSSEPPPPGGKAPPSEYVPPPGYAPRPGYPPHFYFYTPMMSPGSEMPAPKPPPPPPVRNFRRHVDEDELNPKKKHERRAREAVVFELSWNVLEIIAAIILLCVLQVGLDESPLPNTLAFTIPWIAIMLPTIVLDILFLCLKWLKNSRQIIVWMVCVTVKLCADLAICLTYIITVSPKVQAEGYWKILLAWGIVTGLDFFISIACLAAMGIHWGVLRSGPNNNGPYYTRSSNPVGEQIARATAHHRRGF